MFLPPSLIKQLGDIGLEIEKQVGKELGHVPEHIDVTLPSENKALQQINQQLLTKGVNDEREKNRPHNNQQYRLRHNKS